MKTELETTMSNIANEMAIYFDEKVTASALTKWVSLSNDYLNGYGTRVNGNTSEAIGFINTIGWSFLPDLIDCKKKAQRIELLEKEIPHLFSNCFYEGSKKALAEIGISFLDSCVKYKNDEEDFFNFMSILTTLLSLCEKYSEYEYYKRESYKAKAAA